jgi:hypothetical protein
LQVFESYKWLNFSGRRPTFNAGVNASQRNLLMFQPAAMCQAVQPSDAKKMIAMADGNYQRRFSSRTRPHPSLLGHSLRSLHSLHSSHVRRLLHVRRRTD